MWSNFDAVFLCQGVDDARLFTWDKSMMLLIATLRIYIVSICRFGEEEMRVTGRLGSVRGKMSRTHSAAMDGKPRAGCHVRTTELLFLCLLLAIVPCGGGDSAGYLGRLREAYEQSLREAMLRCSPRVTSPKDGTTWTSSYLTIEWITCDLEVCAAFSP